MKLIIIKTKLDVVKILKYIESSFFRELYEKTYCNEFFLIFKSTVVIKLNIAVNPK